MIIELIGAGALVHTFYSADKSMKIDEKAKNMQEHLNEVKRLSC